MRKGLIKKITFFILILTIYWTVFGEKGLMRAYRMAKERDNINARIEKLRRENQYLKNELSGLRNDRHYIEDIARRELGYVREGETVYRFKE